MSTEAARSRLAAALPRGYRLGMDLAFRELGGGHGDPPIVILHGLFGSSQNWAGVGRRLAEGGRGHVVALDMRNHGDSGHAPTHGLADLVGDLGDWAAAHAPGPLVLIGHSMGGLAAMGFALAHPGLTAGVASIDIAPRPYRRNHEHEFQALHTDISGCRDRAALDALLSPLIADQRERQFLLMNAVRDGNGFRWRCNVDAMEKHTVAEDWAEARGRYDGPALLVAGGRSGYVRPSDHEVMRRFFPRAIVEQIPGADHWVNVSAPNELVSILSRFLDAESAGYRDAIKAAPPRR
jgi:esterase